MSERRFAASNGIRRCLLTPKEALQKALSENLTTREGRPLEPTLWGSLETQAMVEFERRLPENLPHEIKELLALASGFEFAYVGRVDFRGELPFEFEDAFPCGLSLAGDGEGNFWVQDIRPDTGAWGAVFFVSHDPPVIVVQAPSLAEFLNQIFDIGRPPHNNALAQIKTVITPRIWADDPYLIKVEVARSSPDSALSAFAKQLAHGFGIADLRQSEVASGLSYNSHGSKTSIVRYGLEAIFATEKVHARSFLDKLLGKR